MQGRIKSMKKSNFIFKLIITVILSLVSLIMILPFILTIGTSLKTMSQIQSPEFILWPKEMQFNNYIEAMKQGDWCRYFMNSIIVTGTTVFFSVIFNTMAGYAFARIKFKGSTFLFFFMLIGIMVPAQVTLIPTFFMMKSFPLVNGNNILGVGGTGLLNTYAGLIIPFVAGSFGVFLCRQFFLSFPKSLDEAAEIDGAGKWRIFFRIYIPLGKPIIATLIITKSAAVWNDYLWPMILTTSNDMRTVQLGLTVFRQETFIQWNYLMAATVLVVLPLIVIFIFLQKYYIGSIMTSGLKE